jgi:N-glycosidase YbiA
MTILKSISLKEPGGSHCLVTINEWCDETSYFFVSTPFPPFNITQYFAATGLLNSGMSGFAEWTPFELTEDHYKEIQSHLVSNLKINTEPSEIPEYVNSVVEWQAWVLHIKHDIDYTNALATLAGRELSKARYDDAMSRGAEKAALNVLSYAMKIADERLFHLLEAIPSKVEKDGVPNVVHFYSTKGKFGSFSNFAAYPFVLEGKTWLTSEHYFQSKKFSDKVYAELIRQQPTPTLAAKLGRSRKVPLRLDWENTKDGIMLDGVIAKFSQNPEIADVLLGTHDAEIVEHTKNDSYWGDGGDGSGKNMLGKILMDVRERLKRER